MDINTNIGYGFDVENITKEVINFIKDYFKENGPTSKAVIGISGGKDSSVVAALCVEALGAENVVGVLMPQNNQSDIGYSIELCQILGIKNYTVNIGASTKDLLDEIKASTGEISEGAIINTPARIRMATLYAIAAGINGRVANTCNLSEDMVGYATLYGDTCGSFAPISDLTVTEVKQIGKYLGLPDKFINKTPTDGLCGKTDEENLGFLYSDLDRFIREDVGEIDFKANIRAKYLANRFKLSLTAKPSYVSLYPNYVSFQGGYF